MVYYIVCMIGDPTDFLDTYMPLRSDNSRCGTTLDIIEQHTMTTMYASSFYGTYLFAV